MNPSSISSALRNHAHPAESGTTGAIAALFAGDAATTPFNDQLAQLNPLLRAAAGASASTTSANVATAETPVDTTAISTLAAATVDQPEADAMANWIRDWLPAADAANPLAPRSRSNGKALGRNGALADAPGLNDGKAAMPASARNIDTLPIGMGKAGNAPGQTADKPARANLPLSGRPEVAANAGMKQAEPATWQPQAVTSEPASDWNQKSAMQPRLAGARAQGTNGESGSDPAQESAMQPTLTGARAQALAGESAFDPAQKSALPSTPAKPLQTERAGPVTTSSDFSIDPRSLVMPLQATPVQHTNDKASTAALQPLSPDAALELTRKAAGFLADEASETSHQPEADVAAMPEQLGTAAHVVASPDDAGPAESRSLPRSPVGDSAGDIASKAASLAPGLPAARETATVPVVAALKPVTQPREMDQKSGPHIAGLESTRQTAEGEAVVADAADELPRQQKAARSDKATDPIASALMATLPVPAVAIGGIDARPRGQQARAPSDDRAADKGWSTSTTLPANAAAVSVAASAQAGTSTRSAAAASATSTTRSGEPVTGPLNLGARTAQEPANGASFAKALELAAQPQAIASQGPGATYSAPSTAAPLEMRFDTPLESPEFRSALGVQVSVLARDGVQHAELSLNPAEMGPISVRIALDGNQAHVEFGVDSAATRAVLESGLPELASALREAGLTLTGGGVSEHARQQADGAPQRQSGDSQGQQGRQGHARADAGRAEAEADTPRDQLRPRRAQLAGGVDMYA